MKALILFLACSFVPLHAAVTEETIEFAGVNFRVVRLEPKQVQVVWKNESGELYRSFDRVQAGFAKQGKTVRFIMNAGIFEPGGIPSGLHVEDGKILHPLNLADAPGNFFLKPNGLLWIERKENARKAFVIPSQTFPQFQKAVLSDPASLECAVQSGPMLLIDGTRHPAFREGSTSRLPRNGVGVDVRGRVVFAITSKGQYVNLWDFAGLFLKLDCQNALFLDGDISQMAVNPDKPVSSNLFGAMFVVAE